MKKKAITMILTIVIIVITLCGCEKRQLVAEYPTKNQTVSLANEEMTDFWLNYEQCCSQDLSLGIDKYKMQGIDFSWNYEGEAEYFIVYVSENDDMSDSISVTALGTTAHFDDLIPGTKYYWKVHAVNGDTVFISDVFTFKTESTMKTIYIDGVTNTRDLGGVTNSKGKKVKYGLIYRGANLDSITTNGKYVFAEIYGIKTDLDLRAPGEGTAANGKGSPAGSEINYINVKAPLYSQIDDDDYVEAFAEEFRVFTKEENYPVYFHCAIGRDRTGTLAFILGAILDLTDDQLTREYETTAFSRYGGSDMTGLVTGNVASLINTLKKFEGKTTKERTISFLKSIGITDEEIQSVRDIMLE